VRACPRDDRAEGRRSRPLPSATTPQGRHAQRRGRSSDAQIALFLERACHRARDRMPSGKSDADALCPLPQRHRDATPRGECDRARDRSSRPDRHRATEPGTGCPLEKKIEPQSHERDATRQEPRTDRATEPRTARSHRATNEPFDAQLQLDPEKPGVDAESEAPAPALASVDPVAVPASSLLRPRVLLMFFLSLEKERKNQREKPPKRPNSHWILPKSTEQSFPKTGCPRNLSYVRLLIFAPS